MTNQEIFDRAVAGLASQGFRRAITRDGFDTPVCQYRAPNGCRCAVGWLIPDDKYKPEWEGNGIVSFSQETPKTLWNESREIVAALGLDHTSSAFLSALQHAHDSAYDYKDNGDEEGTEVDNPAQMKTNLKNLAERYGLTVPEVLNG